MSDTNTTNLEASRVERAGGPAVIDAVRTTESYETDDGMVFYDAENPLAWMLSDHVVDLDSSA
ncbi:MAG: DUF7331 family protein [Halobacteriota archaeon]|uniref:DUF7331 family protein n=1 Tax=Natronomonas sp. TaxID=2184060 RepID=UPI00397588A0